MKKWTGETEFVIQADTRTEAWSKARELMERHFRGLITVTAISLEPLSDPQEWIAINEPIKAQR